MTEIQIVTKTCITCKHEPEWVMASPIEKILEGRCERSGCAFRIKREGPVSTYKEQVITACIGWEPKTAA